MKKYPLLCNNSLAGALELLRSDHIYFFTLDHMETLLPMISVHKVFFESQTKGDNKLTYKYPEKFYKSFMTNKSALLRINWSFTLLLENFYEVGLDNTDWELEWVS